MGGVSNNMAETVSRPSTRISSCMVQYMQNQHAQEQLRGPEMRPHDLRQQPLVAGHEAAGCSPELDEVLQVVDQQGDQHIDQRFPGDIIDQRGLCGYRLMNGSKSATSTALPRSRALTVTCHEVLRVIPVPCEHQGADQRDQVEHEEEKERRRKQREEFLIQFRTNAAHSETSLCRCCCGL